MQSSIPTYYLLQFNFHSSNYHLVICLELFSNQKGQISDSQSIHLADKILNEILKWENSIYQQILYKTLIQNWPLKKITYSISFATETQNF